MTDERFNELLNKVNFVNDLSETISKNFRSVDKITYEVYEHKADPTIVKEFLVYHFDGGAILVRNCTGDSKSAILEEAARYLNGGYYDEVFFYEGELQKDYKRLI